MKLVLLVLLVALVLGGLVGVLVVRDPGYVLVAYDQMAVETSLWFAVLLLVAGYFLIRLVVHLFVRVAQGRVSLSTWHQRRRTRAARDQTVKGLLLMAEGRWPDARKLLESAAPRVQAPLINYLNAARAAQEMGDTSGRDALLRAAHESTAGSRFAVGLTQAELQQSNGQWEQCLATLLQLQRQSPRHPEVLRMLVRCYQHLKDWQAILELVPDLEKRRVLDDAALRALQLEAWRGRLTGNRDDALELWKRVPKTLKHQPDLVGAFAAALAAAERGGDAENLVRQALQQSWDPALVRLYGTLISDEPGRQLVVAEGWLKERPNDPDLLLALGRICLMNRHWARAREYLEASLRLRRTSEVQSELGRLCAALGESERGGELMAQALESLPALPLPERAERLAQRGA